jgi:RHS repeat-associated protein
MKFTGHERDGETGLDFMQARYCSAVQGRFTSPDDVFADQYEGNPQSWNMYSYVRNNPLVNIDPTGQVTCKADGTCIGDYDGERNGKLYWYAAGQLWVTKKEYNSFKSAWNFRNSMRQRQSSECHECHFPRSPQIIFQPHSTGVVPLLHPFRGGIDFINDVMDFLEEESEPREDIYEMGPMISPRSPIVRQIIKFALRGRSLVSGSKFLRRLGLRERITRTGRHEFYDPKTGKVHAAWDPKNSKGGNHWHKFLDDAVTEVNDAGRVVEKTSKAAHIPSK